MEATKKYTSIDEIAENIRNRITTGPKSLVYLEEQKRKAANRAAAKALRSSAKNIKNEKKEKKPLFSFFKKKEATTPTANEVAAAETATVENTVAEENNNAADMSVNPRIDTQPGEGATPQNGYTSPIQYIRENNRKEVERVMGEINSPATPSVSKQPVQVQAMRSQFIPQPPQQQTTANPANPRFAVDGVKPVITPNKRPDAIKLETAKVASTPINLGVLKAEKPSKSTLAPVKDPSTIAIESEQTTPMELLRFDNREITKANRQLAEIEKIAISHGIAIDMKRVPSIYDGTPTKLIHVLAYDAKTRVYNPFKSFTFDEGSIIDARNKIFPFIGNSGYEGIQAYPITIPKKDGKGNEVNKKMFDDIFIGGLQMLPKEGLYTEDFLRLNGFVSLITMPVRSMSNDTKKAVRDRLKAAMAAGVFTQALNKAPGSRWMFESFDKKDNTFILTNKNVPVSFNGPVQSNVELKIKFDKDKVSF